MKERTSQPNPEKARRHETPPLIAEDDERIQCDPFSTLTEKEQTLKKETNGVLAAIASRFKERLPAKAAFAAAVLWANTFTTTLAREARAVSLVHIEESVVSRPSFPAAKERLPHGAAAEQSEREYQGLLERRDEFQRELSFYRGIGYELAIEPRVAIGMDRLDLTSALLSKMSGDEIILVQFEDPLSALRYQHSIDVEVPIELSDGRGNITVVPFALESYRLGDERGMIRIHNMLTRDGTVMYEKAVPLMGERKKVSQEIINEVALVLRGALKEKERRNRMASDIPKDETARLRWTPAYNYMRGAALDDAARENLEQIFSLKSFAMEIEVVPEGKEIDRVVEAGILTKGISLKLTREKLHRSGFSPLEIRGQVKDITLSQDIAVRERGPDTINDEKISELFTDRYGNLVHKYFVTFLGQDERIAKKVLRVYPPIVFGESESPETENREVALDLSPFGLPDIRGYLHRMVENPLGRVGTERQYGIYTNMDHDMVWEQFVEHFPQLGSGIASAERLFGFKPGTHARNIYIVNAKAANAFFHKKDPGTVVFHNELLMQIPKSTHIGTHEALHLLDHRYNISGGLLASLHISLQEHPWFLEEINEKTFLPEAEEVGGHAADNEQEFLASFINSLLHQDWKHVVTSRTPEFQRLYLATHRSLLQRLEEIEELDKNAPILKILREGIVFLETLSDVKP